MGSPPLHAELIRLILEELYTPPASFFLEWKDKKLERSALHALCLTSKVLNYEATRLLYADMTEQSGDLQYEFLGTIEKKPELAALVQRYHTPKWDQAKLNSERLGRLRRSLQHMVNLKELSVSPFYRGYPRKIYPTVSEDGKMPFQLVTFKYNVLDLSTRYQTEVLEFLATQVELNYLTWQPNTNIEPKYLERISHKLIRLEGSAAAISSILPGRSIKELGWRTMASFNGHGFKTPADCNWTMNIFNMPEFRSLTHLFLPHPYCFVLLEHLAELKIGPFENLEVFANNSSQERNATTAVRLLQLFPKLNALIIRHSENLSPDCSFHKETLTEIFGVHRNIQWAYLFCGNEYIHWTRETDGTFKTQLCRLKTGHPLVRYMHDCM